VGRTFCLAAAFLGAIVLAPCADAADISRSDPDFLLPCEEVFEGDRIAPGYVDTIADFAIPKRPQASQAEALGADPAVPDRLSKWPGKMRMVVRSDIAMSRSAFTNLSLYLSGWSEFEIDYVWDNDGTVKLQDGDLLVYVTSHHIMKSAKTENPKLDAMLVEFYGSSEAASKVNEARQHFPAWLGFIDVIRNQNHEVQRAIVVLHSASYHWDRGNWLLELLTSALNPNPGNAAYQGLPGGTPQEKRIYDRLWSSNLDYALVWSREFQTYMAVLYDESVKPGVTRAELVGAATRILNRPELQKRIFTAHNCKNEM
jgi:hypothetical protein